MVTEQEIEQLRPLVWPWDSLVYIQCTKPPDVVNGTAELLAEIGCHERRKCLTGVSTVSISYLSVVMRYPP